MAKNTSRYTRSQAELINSHLQRKLEQASRAVTTFKNVPARDRNQYHNQMIIYWSHVSQGLLWAKIDVDKSRPNGVARYAADNTSSQRDSGARGNVICNPPIEERAGSGGNFRTTDDAVRD